MRRYVHVGIAPQKWGVFDSWGAKVVEVGGPFPSSYDAERIARSLNRAQRRIKRGGDPLAEVVEPKEDRDIFGRRDARLPRSLSVPVSAINRVFEKGLKLDQVIDWVEHPYPIYRWKVDRMIEGVVILVPWVEPEPSEFSTREYPS